MTRRRRTSVVAALLAAASTTAAAAPRAELSVAAGLDSAYDDNVFNGRGPDFVNRVSPYGTLRVISSRLTLDAGYALGYWTYALGKADNSINHRASLAVEGKATRRLTLRVADEFVRAEDPGFLTRVGVVAPQIGIIDNVADLLVGYAISRRLYGNLAYSYHHTSFDAFSAAQLAAGAAPLFDSDEHTPAGLLTVRITRLDDLRLGARAQVFTAGPQSVTSARWALGAAYSPSVGWRHRFVRPLEATLDVGPVFYQALDRPAEVIAAPRSGTTWRMAARLRWYTPSWRSSIAYTRDLVGATGVGSAIWADYVYAQLGYHFRELVDAHVGLGYFRNGRAVDQPVAYDGFTLDALVDWRVVDNFRMGAYYTLRFQRTGPGAVEPGLPVEVPQFPDVTRNIVGIRLLAVLGADARPPRREVHE
jgi:hypothetical protein